MNVALSFPALLRATVKLLPATWPFVKLMVEAAGLATGAGPR
jgi:hypothetical protein